MNTYTKIPDSILHSKDFDGLNKCRHFALIDLYSLMRNKPGTSFFNRNEFWLNKYQIVKLKLLLNFGTYLQLKITYRF